MTWLYVPSASSTATEDSNSDSSSPSETTVYEPWLVLSGTATQRPLSWRGWKTRPWIRLLCGMTSSHSTAQRGVDEWISSLQDSHASPGLRLGSGPELTTTVGSGRRSPVSSVRWDRDSSSWRTCQDSTATDQPEVAFRSSSKILPTSGSMRSGVCTPQPTLEPLTSDSDSGLSLWPTTTTSDAKSSGGYNPDWGHGVSLTDRAVRLWTTPCADDTSTRKAKYAQGGSALSYQAMWPTPTASDLKGNKGVNRKSPSLGDERMWPTPRASEMSRGSDPARGPKGGSTGLKHDAEHWSGHPDPTTATGGTDGEQRADLNPRFVAALMGVPLDWLTPSTSVGTDSFRQWQRAHSSNSSPATVTPPSQADAMTTDIDKQLDDSPRAGLVYERGFWRHPVTKAAMLVMPDGKSKQLRSPSGDFKNHLDETTNLEKWKQRQIVTGLLDMVATAGLPTLPEDDKARRHVLDAVILDAMRIAGANDAADRGSHTHLTTELEDEGAHWLTVAEQGEETGLPTPVQRALVTAWLNLLEHYALEIVAIEKTVANEIAAGTLDRLARTTVDLEFTRVDGSRVFIPAGTVLVLDVKTGQLRVERNGAPMYWVGYSHQIGLYANSQPVRIDPEDPKGNVWEDWPEAPSTEHALIAHLDVKNALETGVACARMIYVDLTLYRPMCETINSVRYWRKSRPFSDCSGVPDVVVDVADPVQTWLQGRIDVIGEHEVGRRLLVQHWPDEVPPLKNGLDPAHVDQIVGLLNRVETEIGTPFGPSDPRIPPRQLRRRG